MTELGVAGNNQSSTRRLPSRADAFALLLLLAVTLPWVSSFFEWKHFRQELNLLDIRPWAWRELPLVWLHYAKTQLVLLPALLLAALLIAVKWRKSAVTLFLLWTVLVFAWLEADKQTYTLTNIHVLSYLQFAGGRDATLMAGGNPWLNSLDIAGGLKPVLLLSLAIAGGVWGLNIVTRRFFSPQWRTRLAVALACTYVVLFLAVAPAQRSFNDRHELQRMHAILPFDMTWSAVGMDLVDTSAFAVPFNSTLAPTLRHDVPILTTIQPIDTKPHIDSGPRPNVLLMLIESLREDAMIPSVMPRLCKLSERGMRLSQHYAGSRMSHLGSFNLLFGRTSAVYYMTLIGGANVTPQSCVTLKSAGYRTTYTSSIDHREWVRMGQFINDQTFDEMSLFHAKSWITRDGRTLAHVKELLDASTPSQPQFITAFVASTHYPYTYPPEFGTRTPCLPEKFRFMSLRREVDMPLLRNRYMNSCAFMDSQVADMIDKIDLTKTLVIVTGDHGESLLDDGAMAHGGRWSDSQLRVPCFFIGAGISPRVVTDATTHVDVLPTMLHVVAGKKVPLEYSTGRDILAGDLPPAFQVLGANSLEKRYDLLVSHDGRRMLFEFPISRFDGFVRGSVDLGGEVDPFNVPAASEAKTWGDGVAGIFDQLTK